MMCVHSSCYLHCCAEYIYICSKIFTIHMQLQSSKPIVYNNCSAPLQLTACIQILQGTVRLFIRVDDYDRFNANDHVNDIYVNITLTPSSSFTSTRAYNGINVISVMELSFRLQCTSNFYGSDCTTYCVARDDIEGHFDCGPDGEKICLSGWSDPSRNCTIICKLYMQTIVHGAATNQ